MRHWTPRQAITGIVFAHLTYYIYLYIYKRVILEFNKNDFIEPLHAIYMFLCKIVHHVSTLENLHIADEYH